MILVVLAIGTGLSPFASYNIWPVSPSNKIDSLAVIAGGVPLAVRIGMGLGVGVKGVTVEVSVEVDPSKRRFPTGVKVKIGTRIIVLIEMNSRAIAIVRRIIYSSERSSP